jgi:pentafunctional AROM polypeptide
VAREHIPRDIPIIYTVRTVAEGGRIPDELDPEVYLDLYLLGVELGCEIIDIQMNMSNERVIQPFLRTVPKGGQVKIIASYHQISPPLEWGGPECLTYLNRGQALGDVVKIVSVSNNESLETFLQDYYKTRPKIPLIALNMGISGQGSRLSNRYLTPVTAHHPKIPPNPNLSQLTVKEIIQGLEVSGRLRPKCFYIFGHPVAQSLSPLLHNTIFAHFGFPHVYSRFDSMDMTEIEKVIRDPNFGGGSVTMPHKRSVIPLMDSISEAARVIGAVNTIIVQRGTGKLVGDNTDWTGVLNCLKRTISDHPRGNLCTKTALVFGAGGTARAVLYALNEFGMSTVFVYNRSADRLQELFQDFKTLDLKLVGLKSIEEVEGMGEGDGGERSPFVVVDTCPAAAGNCDPRLIGKIFRPHEGQGVLVKLAYTGQRQGGTGTDLGPGVSVVTGLDILIEQGLRQSELWTGLRPDPAHIRAQVYEKVGEGTFEFEFFY